MLALRQSWTRQPPPGTRINWRNPVTRHLKHLWVFHGDRQMVDLVTGPQGLIHVSGGDFRAVGGVNGRVASFNEQTATAEHTYAQLLPNTYRETEHTILAIVKGKDASGTAPSSKGAQFTGPFHAERQGHLNWHHSSAGVVGTYEVFTSNWNSVQVGPFAANVWYNIVVSYSESHGRLRSYKEGRLFDQFGTAGSLDSTAQLGLFAARHAQTAGSVWCGQIAFLALWDSELSLADGGSVQRNPWQLFEPQTLYLFSGQSVGGGVTGTLTGTLAALSLSSNGALDVSGSLSGALAALTLSAAGELDASGSLTGTLEAVTASSSAELALSGSLATTLADAALSAVGTTVIGKTGSVQSTLDAATLSAAGELAVTGALSGTLEDLGLTAAGEFAGNRTGALSATLEGATLTAAGRLPIVGLVAVTLDDATLTSGTLPPVPSPPGRTFVVEASNRTFTVPARNRTYTARGATSGNSTFGTGKERAPRQYRVDHRRVGDSQDTHGRRSGELRGSGFRHGAGRAHVAGGLDGRSSIGREGAERYLAGCVRRCRGHSRAFPSLRSDGYDLSPAGHGDGERRRRRHDGRQRRICGGSAVHHHELYAH